jgi:hypothetical protein
MWFFLCAKIHNNFGIAKKKGKLNYGGCAENNRGGEIIG